METLQSVKGGGASSCKDLVYVTIVLNAVVIKLIKLPESYMPWCNEHKSYKFSLHSDNSSQNV